MEKILHSVNLIEENCKGCTRCMLKCPVEAIRLRNSKAIIYTDKCIDCGECIRVCPYNAHVAEKDDLDMISKYKIKVAIPSVTLYVQFGDFINPEIVDDAIRSIGFDEVYDITYACDIVYEITKKEIEKMHKPAISPFCPSIAKIIQTSFPELLDNVIKVLTPIEVAAELIRDKYYKLGYRYEDIGIFYLTPCTGWITKVKYTSLNKKSQVNGSIGINSIFSKLLKYINKKSQAVVEKPITMSFTGLSWANVGGQSRSMNLDEYIAVSGVENVIKVFDDVAKGKLKNVEFIDAFACNGGCLGGILLVENPYNAERILRKYCHHLNFTYKFDDMSDEYKEKFIDTLQNIKVYNQKLADDFESAVKKMKYMNKLINTLPGVDCGLCGSPSCKAFAEDVVRGLSNIKMCTMIDKGEESNES